MTTDDKMREIEAALRDFLTWAMWPDGYPDGLKAKLLATIRAAIAPPAGSHPLCRGEFDVTLHTDGTGLVAGMHFTIKWKKSGMVDRFVPEREVRGLLDMAERCANAEKAATTVEYHSFTGTDRTYEDLLAKEKAAGELLRVARVSRDRTMSNEDYDDLCGAIDAAERAGVRP